jgi:hypothetical protein
MQIPFCNEADTMSSMTIDLPSDVELALSGEAKKLGTTPEMLTVRILHERFGEKAIAADQIAEDTTLRTGPRNLAEFLGDFIGCVDSSHGTGEKSDLSERTGEVFAEILAQKHREGRL